MGRLRSARVGAGVTVALLACAGTAATAGAATYGSPRKPPYLFMTVSGGKVMNVRWNIYESCPRLSSTPEASGEYHHVFRAAITHGHFSKKANYATFGPSFLATIDWTVSIRGTITGRVARITLRESHEDFANGKCSGSHTFTVIEGAA